MTRTALVGGTIHAEPRSEPIRNGAVLIEGEKIAAVGPRQLVSIPDSAEEIDCSGLTITAGFWNSHVHFFERKWANAAEIPAPELSRQLEVMLMRYGFTSVFDTGSMWENTRLIRDRIESGEAPGPRIRSTGEGLLPPGALPPDLVLNMMGVMKFPAPEVADESQAEAAARKLLDDGVDGIKLFASSPRSAPLPESAIRAAVKEAHRAAKPAFVHPNSGADVLTALRAGVDIIAHTRPHSGPWDDAILSAMKERQAALTPTLTLWRYYARHDRTSTQDQIGNTAIAQLRAWLGAGGTVLFGTDLGAVEYDPGEEYASMARAGMNFPEILASLTTAPAARFGDATRIGKVAAGFHADLVVLKDDPSRNLSALTSVQYTFRSGRLSFVQRETA